MDKMRMESANIIEKNIEMIGELFPGVLTERAGADGKLRRAVDFDALRQLLGEDASAGDEAYAFTWVGKRAAMAEACRPIRKTLRPCPQQSRNWDTTQNIYIEGENLKVLKLLQESYLGRIKMIYIDPPYNTGHDFIYRDSFAHSQEEEEAQMGVFDEETGERLFENSESRGRFHSDWCSMIYARLIAARSLLTDDGAIFISIDDNELENLKKICNEVFGEANFIGQWNWFKSATPPNLSKKIKKNIEYILCYEKKRTGVKYRGLRRESLSSNSLLNQINKSAVLAFPAGSVETGLADGTYPAGTYGTSNYEIELLDDAVARDGRFINEFRMRAKFRWSQENLLREIAEGTRIAIRTDAFSPSYERNEYDPEVPPNFISRDVQVDTTEQAGKNLAALFGGAKIFDYPKPVELIAYLINFLCGEDDIILDFFSGSATTAHAVMQLNAADGGHRRFIMVQMPEICREDSEARRAGYATIADIGRERIRRAGDSIIAGADEIGKNIDIGFRAFRLDESNMKEVYYGAGEYTQAMLMDLISNIREDRTPLDLLFGCLLDWGLPLSLPCKSELIDGFTVYSCNGGELIACFDANISEAAVREIAGRRPRRALFRDSGFTDSPARINLDEIFRMLAPSASVKVI